MRSASAPLPPSLPPSLPSPPGVAIKGERMGHKWAARALEVETLEEGGREGGREGRRKGGREGRTDGQP